MTKSEGDGRGGWGCEAKAVDREGGGCGGVRGERGEGRGERGEGRRERRENHFSVQATSVGVTRLACFVYEAR